MTLSSQAGIPLWATDRTPGLQSGTPGVRKARRVGGFPGRLTRLLGAVGAAVLVGCATQPSASPPAAGSDAARLYERDLEFAASARALGVAEAFRIFLSERAILLPNGEPPVQGLPAIYEHQRQAGDVQLTWAPVAAEVARSGELGYTWGFYEVQAREPDGTIRTGHGKYATIWEKQPDGWWKVILDTGNPGPPPLAPFPDRPRRRPRLASTRRPWSGASHSGQWGHISQFNNSSTRCMRACSARSCPSRRS